MQGFLGTTSKKLWIIYHRILPSFNNNRRGRGIVCQILYNTQEVITMVVVAVVVHKECNILFPYPGCGCVRVSGRGKIISVSQILNFCLIYVWSLNSNLTSMIIIIGVILRTSSGPLVKAGPTVRWWCCKRRWPAKRDIYGSRMASLLLVGKETLHLLAHKLIWVVLWPDMCHSLKCILLLVLYCSVPECFVFLLHSHLFIVFLPPIVLCKFLHCPNDDNDHDTTRRNEWPPPHHYYSGCVYCRMRAGTDPDQTRPVFSAY